MSRKDFDLPTQGRICAVCPNMCRFLCPVASVEKIETVTPRGKATLVRGLETGQVAWNEAVARVFYHCAGCKICREWCPSDVDLPEVMDGLRVRAAAEGLVPAPVRTLRDRLVAGGSLYGPAGELSKSLDRYREMLAGGLASKSGSPAGAGVLYFAGCSTSSFYPETIEATLRLFEAAGVRAIMLSPEECCGLPLDVLGFRGDAAAFARRLAGRVALSGARTVVSGCPMCTYVLKNRYPALGVAVAADIKHTTEFLSELHDAGTLGAAGTSRGGGAPASAGTSRGGGVPASAGSSRGGGVPASGGSQAESLATYHDPCYLGRYQGVYDPPRRLLRDVAGYGLVEMERSRELGGCCGGSPAVDAAAPQVATFIGARRFEEARRTGAGTVVTACPHCRSMLGAAAAAATTADGLARAGRPESGSREAIPTAVRDIAEVLAERCGVPAERSRTGGGQGGL